MHNLNNVGVIIQGSEFLLLHMKAESHVYKVIYTKRIKIHIPFFVLDKYSWNVGDYGKTIPMLWSPKTWNENTASRTAHCLQSQSVTFWKRGLHSLSCWKATTALGGKAVHAVPPLLRESGQRLVPPQESQPSSRQNNRQCVAATILTGYFPKLLKQIKFLWFGISPKPLNELSAPKPITRPGGKRNICL